MIMITEFWLWEEKFLVGYMPHNSAVIGDAYAAVLQNLKEVIKEKRRPRAQVAKNNGRRKGMRLIRPTVQTWP
jgi:hypothetical protein